MIYFLYTKIHNKTKKKYLGKTESDDPYKYQGSGKYWKNHIKKHGNDVTTEIIGAFDTQDDLKVAGLFWSKKWNIVESKEWLNLREESGNGNPKGLKLTEIHKNKIRLALQGKNHPMFGKKHSPETIEKIRIARKNQIVYPVSEETRQKLSKSKFGEKNPMYGKIPANAFRKGNIPWNKHVN